MSEVTSTHAASGSNSNSPHNIEPSDVYCISDKLCRHDWGNKPEPIRGGGKGERENCDPTAHYDPCIPYTGCADFVPSIGCGTYQEDRPHGKAHTLELNLEDAERLMPEPTTRAPWFGYESFAGYGEDGLDAVADNDGDVYIASCICKGCEKDDDTNVKVDIQDSTLKTDNDTVDVKDTTVNTDVNTDRANGRGERSGSAGSSGGEGASGSGSGGGSGRAGTKK